MLRPAGCLEIDVIIETMKKRTIITLCLLLCATVSVVAQTPLCLGDNYYQKRMVKVFEALQDQKLDKVAKYWQEIEEKAATDGSLEPLKPISQQLSPVWELSEAMMMNTRDGHGKLTNIVPYNPWGAYMQLKKACSDPLAREIADRFLSHKSLKMSVAEIKADIEKNLVDTVRHINTESAYDQLLEMLYDYDDLSTLENERELIAYNSCKRSTQLDDCQHFLDKYGKMNETHHFTIEWRRDSLAFERLGKNAAACKAYLAAYPSSRFNNSVQEMLHRYAFDELDMTVEACKEYQQLYPQSEYIDTVKALEVSYAFRDAKKVDKIGSLNQFLKNYPDSRYQEEAQQLLQQAVMRRYFNPMVTLEELHRFYHAADDDLVGVDKSRIRTLYHNLVFMPTSAFMKGCDGLMGRVFLASSPDMLQDEEVMIFNDQGLLVRHYRPDEGINDRYYYVFDPDYGFMLQSKVMASGKVVSYSSKWNEQGDIVEVAGSDGSIQGYSRDYEYLKKVMQFKGRTVTRTDYYDQEFKLDKSVLSGNMTMSYHYNLDGDRTAVYKRRGKSVVDSTTYQYGYVDRGTTGRLWEWKNQSNNGKLQPTRYRQFDRTFDKIHCDAYSAYTIDWYDEPQPADTARVSVLIAELDGMLQERAEALKAEKMQEQAAMAAPTNTAPEPVVVLPSGPNPSEKSMARTLGDNPPATAPVKDVHEPKSTTEAAPPAQVSPAASVPVREELEDEEVPVGKEGLLKKLMKDMVLVEGGVFNMGATSEQDDDAWELEFPAHQVKLSSFYICKVEVTQELWEVVMGTNPSTCKGKNMPVDMVSWNDCQKFIEKLNEMTGEKFRLPTEAEWEYAARGGNSSRHYKYAGSNDLNEVAWYNTNSDETSHPVGKKHPNELGLFDMSGNVWEWCADWQNFYSADLQINPVGDYPSSGRIQRGGCWNQSDALCRVSFRGVSSQDLRSRDTGLRLAASKLNK